MYKIKNYEFESFKLIAHMHHSNYAVLDNDPGHGIKYCPHLDFEDEFFILKNLDHKQIPNAYEYGREMMFKDEKEVLNQNFIILDHLSSTDFMGYFKGKTIEEVTENLDLIKECFISACDPLDYLHSKGYVHTDIKPGHLMLNPESNTVFLIDFELVIENHALIKGISKDYASPEHEKLVKLLRDADEKYLDSIAEDIGIDGRSDIFSLGAIMFEILTQKKWAETKTALRNLNNLIPPNLEKVIMSTLEEDPKNRIGSIVELKQELLKI